MLIGDLNPNHASQNSAAAGDIIFDVGTDDFEERVLKASLDKPIIVEFWAPWCGPCKQLMPILEKAVQSAGGDVLMAKVNMDDNQQLAAMLRIQSVPTVYAFFGGQPVDAFQGNVPESEIQKLMQKLIEIARQSKPEALDIPAALTSADEAMNTQDLQTAQNLYAQILQQDPAHAKAFAGMVRVFIAAGQVDQAEAFLNSAPEAMHKDSAYKDALSALELARSKPDGSAHSYLQAIATDPQDYQAHFDLSLLLFSDGQHADAIEHLLTIIAQNRDWNDDAARQQLLKCFEALGQTHPLTIESRRKLSSLLFS